MTNVAKQKATSKLKSCPVVCFEKLHTIGIAKNIFQVGDEERCQITE